MTDSDTGGSFKARPLRRGRLVLLLLLCLQPLIVFITFQRRLIYLPLRETPDLNRAQAALRAPILPFSFDTDDGLILNGWLIPASSRTGGALAQAVADDRPVCLWFNGNAGHRAHRLPQVALIHKLGAHAVVMDYRGYAENPGSPSEEGLAKDARAVWNFTVKTLNIPAARIVICGESLGGGVATRLAADLCRGGTPPAGLFLQATFTSLVETGAYHYPFLPVRWVLQDRFDSLSRIADVSCPIAMVHGRIDSIVPFEQGRKLYDAAPAQSASGVAKSFIEMPTAGHNDIMDPDVGAIPLWTAGLEGLLKLIPAPVETTAD